MKRLIHLFAAVLLAPATGLSFAHLWKIQEIYSNADGSVQFVEFFTNTGTGEIFLSGQTLSFQISGLSQTMMTFSDATATDGDGNLAGGTLNKTVLIGTASLSLYGITPDYIIPANFLSAGSLNSVIFSASSDRVNLTNLPTNGVASLDGLVNNGASTAAATAVNPQAVATNFAGQSAVVPEPGTAGCMILGAGALGVLAFIRRRSSRQA